MSTNSQKSMNNDKNNNRFNGHYTNDNQSQHGGTRRPRTRSDNPTFL